MAINVFIYIIKCPDTNEVKYVGKTIDPKYRFRKHLSYKRITRLSKWLMHLKKCGKQPAFEVIAEVPEFEWEQHEKAYIELFKSKGAALLNHTTGGEGGNTMGGRKLTKEQSEKIRLSKIGKPNKGTGLMNVAFKGKKIDQFDKEGNFIKRYNSIREAGRAINRDDRRIQFMVKGVKMNGKNINHVGGFIFKYSNGVTV